MHRLPDYVLCDLRKIVGCATDHVAWQISLVCSISAATCVASQNIHEPTARVQTPCCSSSCRDRSSYGDGVLEQPLRTTGCTSQWHVLSARASAEGEVSWFNSTVLTLIRTATALIFYGRYGCIAQ